MKLTTFLHKLNEAKFRKPVVMYHGTSDAFLKNILSSGIEPNPKEKVWDEDPGADINMPSRVSLQGSYWTTNIITASSSANRATSKFGGNKLYVVAQIAEQSAFADEDNLTGKFNWAYSNALRNIGFSTETSPAKLLSYMSDKRTGHSIVEKLPEEFAKETHRLIKSSDMQPIDTDLLKKAFWVFFRRILAHEKKYGSFDTILGGATPEFQNMIDSIPDIGTAEREWTDMREILTRRYTKSARDTKDEVNVTLRLTEPVTYRGSNKILCIMGDKPESDTESKYDTPKILYYGDPDGVGFNQFVEDYRQMIGPFPGAEDKHGNTVYPSDRDIENATY